MSKLKFSGINWIGDIPCSWCIKRLKYLKNTEENSFVDGDWIDSEYIENTGIRYYTTGNIGDGKFKEQGYGFISELTFKKLKCKYMYPGDLIFSRLNAPYGRSCILPDKEKRCIVAVDNVVLRTNEDKRYLCYVTQTDGYHNSVKDYSNGSTMQRISRINLGNVFFPIPPKKEQKLIADFLDIKVGIIEDIIVDLNKQVELLKSIKQSTIDEYVSGKNKLTNKINTGIDWIKEIPEDWKLVPIKNVANVHSSTRVFEEEYMEYGVPFFRTKEIVELANDKEISLELFISEEKYKTLKKNKPKVNDLLISSIGTIGEVWLCDGRDFWYKDGNITQIDSNGIFDSRFMKYFIKSSIFVESIKYYESTTTISALTIEKIKRIKMPFPSLNEQTQIADLLDSKCKKIDEIINKKIEELNKIEQYKKSVIYEYVTGKKRVKGAEELYG